MHLHAEKGQAHPGGGGERRVQLGHADDLVVYLDPKPGAQGGLYVPRHGLGILAGPGQHVHLGGRAVRRKHHVSRFHRFQPAQQLLPAGGLFQGLFCFHATASLLFK